MKHKPVGLYFGPEIVTARRPRNPRRPLQGVNTMSNFPGTRKSAHASAVPEYRGYPREVSDLHKSLNIDHPLRHAERPSGLSGEATPGWLRGLVCGVIAGTVVALALVVALC